jgi:hypothetical protein
MIHDTTTVNKGRKTNMGIKRPYAVFLNRAEGDRRTCGEERCYKRPKD